MILNSCRQFPPCLLQVHKCYVHHLHHKVDHYPPGRYDHHGGVLASVNIHLGCLAIAVDIYVYLDVGSSS